MPKSKHRKNHKHALNKSKKPGGVLAQLVDSMMPVAPSPSLYGQVFNGVTNKKAK